MELKPPPATHGTTRLKRLGVEPHKLFRISGHDGGEPYFGKSAKNRFDDPARGFGTCYLGLTLGAAFAETVLHDEVAVDGGFRIALEEFERRFVVRFIGIELLLGDLTGAPLKRLGADGSLSSVASYDVPQQWSAWIHTHPDNVDGFVYMSRHFNTKKSVVLFERAKAKLRATTYTALARYPGIWNTKRMLGVTVDYR